VRNKDIKNGFQQDGGNALVGILGLRMNLTIPKVNNHSNSSINKGKLEAGVGNALVGILGLCMNRKRQFLK